MDFKEKPSVEDTLKRMKETKIQDLDQLRFKEWTPDLKGLEFSRVLTVPYETPNVRIVSEDPGSQDRIWIRCATLEDVVQTHGLYFAKVGDAVQVDSRTWCLITANTVRESVKPENLAKAWKSLRCQQLPSGNLIMHAFDWYRGAFHFQDWYRLVTASMSKKWDVLMVANRTHQLSPGTSVREALRLVDSWMRINIGNQQLPRTIWADLDNICPPEEPVPVEPAIGRTIRYRDDGPRPDYSAFISYSEEDFLQVQGTMVLAMPADLNPKSAMAKAILREYDKEKIFRLRPRVGSVIHVDSSITDQPGVELWLLIVRSSQRQVAMIEDLHSALKELAGKFSDDHPELLHFPMLDMERGLNHLPNLYNLLDEIFYQSSVGIVLHDRAFVSIGQVQFENLRTPYSQEPVESCENPRTESLESKVEKNREWRVESLRSACERTSGIPFVVNRRSVFNLRF